MASITLRLFTALKIRIIMANKTEMSKWLIRRVRLALVASSFSTPRMSTQKEVVNAVNAESALLKAAAMIPIVKKIRMECPNMPEVQNIGRISSFNTGNSIFFCEARLSNNTPRARNRKFTGVKAKPYVYIFFCASFRLLQDKFFCIIS